MTAAILGAWVPSASSYDLVVAPSIGGTQETLSLSVTAGTPYYLSGDGDSDDLIGLLETLLNTHSGISGLELELDGETVSPVTGLGPAIDGADAGTTFPVWILGLGETDSLLGSAAPSALVWRPGVSLSFDSRDRQVLIRGRRQSLSGRVYTADFGDALKAREVTFELVEQEHMLEEYALTDLTAFESLDRRALSRGVPFRLYEDEAGISAGTDFAEYRLAEPADARRSRQWTYRWDVELRMRAT